MAKKAMASDKKSSSKLKRHRVKTSAKPANSSSMKVSFGGPRTYKVVVVKNGPSRYGVIARQAFRRGVQQQFEHLAKLGVATFAEVNGKIVRGIPKRVGSRWVITQEPTE